MNEAEILAEIAALAREKLERDIPLRPGMRLVEDLELDSLGLLTLAVEVENRFEICLDEEDEIAIETVADLVEVIRGKRGRRSPGDDPSEERV